jgi:hypothetical protein
MSARDTAEPLKMVPPPIATATRRFVYVADSAHGGSWEMERHWRRWGGDTEFVDEADPSKVGIVIFQLRCPPYVCGKLAERLRPFYAKAGTEANVFEFDPVLKLFTRRDPSWLEHPGRVISDEWPTDLQAGPPAWTTDEEAREQLLKWRPII